MNWTHAQCQWYNATATNASSFCNLFANGIYLSDLDSLKPVCILICA